MSNVDTMTAAAQAASAEEPREEQELDLSDLLDDGILEEAERIKERLRHTTSGE